MTPRERLLTALAGGTPDRLPVTTHHVMPYFLETYLDGISAQEFFRRYSLDAVLWTVPHRAAPDRGEYADPLQGEIGFLESQRVSTDAWRIECEAMPGHEYRTTRCRFITPRGILTTILQSNQHTTWVVERLIKRRQDIDLIGEYVTAPKCDVEAVNEAASAFGYRGIVRGHIPCFDVFGQPGCWQDAACLVGTEELILAAYDDPAWVHELLGILQRRKKTYVHSLVGASYDLLELGGGSASSTVISPTLFDQFVAPYDRELIQLAHEAGQRIVYHTCGGMMPLLEQIADMGPDAMETFTPPGMGGDTDLREAKRRIGDRVCMIGGFDQYHYLIGCTPDETRAAVRRCFDEAGSSGGYILCPSDHFFDADPALIEAFADEAKRCTYTPTE
jgi:uroporphyrinogen-III decarboxylase